MNGTVFRRILCIRPDNMGDVLMSTPAIRALKETFNAHITLLSSSQGAALAPFIPEIDAVVELNVPWIQHLMPDVDMIAAAEKLRALDFDLAVIFTVYSQSQLPAALLAYMAAIPYRVAYCRENPYRLLTCWVPDKEPLQCMDKHQVQRDLDLVAAIGAHTADHRLSLQPDLRLIQDVVRKLDAAGADASKPWCVLHPGTRDARRRFPLEQWQYLAASMAKTGLQLLITGDQSEQQEAAYIREQVPEACFNLAGALPLAEWIVLIGCSPLLISINSLPVHVAAALQTPVIVLYARTNPQHTPWKVASNVFYFDVPEALKSKNELLRFVDRHYSWKGREASAKNILEAAQHFLYARNKQVAAAFTHS